MSMTARAEPGYFGQGGAGGESAARPWRRLRLARILAALVGLVFLGFMGIAGWIAWGLPEIDFQQPANARPSIVLEAADGARISQSGGNWAGPVRRDELPEHLVQAVLAIEDRRFYDHSGLDFFGILRAAYRNLNAGDIVEGGSTITQQLAKVLFLDREQTLRRKLQEALIATWLEARLSKDEILTEYLDSVYFGAGATGISAAARTYFDKDVAELDLAESAMLAGLIRAPSRLNPLSNLRAARERATLVLQAMVQSGYITREEAIAAALNPAAPLPTAAVADTGSWFGDWVYGEAVSRMGPLVGEARIRTTLQPRLQAIAENVVGTALAEAGAESRAGQAALVAMTMDGAVVAMVGGRSYEESQFNRAASAERQPGSAFKTFVYLAALRSGWSLDDTIADAPVEIDGWRPQNFSGRYQGEVTIEQAFARSLNAPTVRLAADIGIDKVIDVARELGIDADLQPNMSLALGAAELTLLDLTGAYASIAAGRTPLQPWGIAGVSGDAGVEPAIFAKRPAPTRPLEHRDETLALLTAVVEDGTGTRAALEGFAAGKTGTSQDHRDAWFAGFTDDLVVGVWVGNDDNSPMNGVVGGGLPAEIWRSFMAEASGLAPVEVAESEPAPEEPPAAEDQGSAEPATEGAEEAEAASRQEEFGEAEDEAPPPEEDVAAREEEADPEEQAAAEPAPPARARTAEPQRQQAEEAQPRRRQTAREEPEAEPRAERRASSEPESGLARNRARAEEYAARRRAEAEREAGVEGPSILLGGRGFSR